MIAQLAFVAVLGFFGFLLFRRIQRIKKNIQLGKPQTINDNPSERWKTMLLVAFGQKKMFKRLLPAFFHFLIYIGFILINIEVLEIVLDGLLGTHRVFAPFLGSFYTVLISFFEVLAVLVIVACVVFLLRRNIAKVDRFHKIEMKGWPTLDGNLILVIETVLMIAILSMNAADQVLQDRGADHYTQTGEFLISGMMKPLFANMAYGGLIALERAAWWFHIVGIFAFAVYVTYSKHLHIFLAFPNTFYSRLEPKGKMNNMQEITNEVKIMLGMSTGEDAGTPPEGMKFGAKDINDLTWKNLMEAYSCTECGRCTSECPANLTGKKLSPRKIMMDTRDRMEDVGLDLQKGGKGLEDGKSLLDDYISREEINACTNCNACVEACPVNISPLEIILQLRRYVAMEESAAPQSWNMMFQNVETNFAPWKFAPSDRFKWADALKEK
ncbi:MAG: Fe-S oxidoreductase [Flammeovirgaceae bacterium]|nr:Fe-S oxidoreductase [Flammeovirgaceae bacterium]MBE61473.1 Fe-S oxidoreductase [Flammeovirgaceae bacterium]HCX24325.1 Fe-S oxidoreductase [Cytophagales bacterium]